MSQPDQEYQDYQEDVQEYPAALDRQGHPTQTRVQLTCPFCTDQVLAYRWSLAGSGKRCPCGALLTQRGAWRNRP